MSANANVPALETRDLVVGYGSEALVRDVCIRVLPGQIVTLVGPNGAGKSTILRTIAGQQDALGGQVCLLGRDLAQMSLHEQSLVRSVLLTDQVRTELLSCADVVEMGRYPHMGRLGIATEHDRAVMRRAMELADVWDLRDRDFARLSDGQRQRVMLARAICQEPRVLLLDEPTSYLDIRYQIELLRLLRRLAREEGVAIVMSLHELLLARQVSDWLVCVKDGTVATQGTPEEVVVPAVIDALYDLEPGSFDPLTGMVSLDETIVGQRRMPQTEDASDEATEVACENSSAT